MTKKDGDRLRKMHDDVITMARSYENGCDTQDGLSAVAMSIDYALAGVEMQINVGRSERSRILAARVRESVGRLVRERP